MIKILMVCLGNICRSPLAEGILQSKLTLNTIERNNSINFFVDSAGTGGFHVDELPDSRSIEIAKKNGIDITTQRCRQFQIEDFDTFDYIYAMDQSNYNNIVRLARNETDKNKVKLILIDKDVPDPYYGGKDGFKDVFMMLDKACDKIINELV